MNEQEQATSVVAEKDKVTLKIGLPKNSATLDDLQNLFSKLNEATFDKFEVVVRISTSAS
ncbi:MAG: hypothetical protein WBI40_07440 [Methylococcaceae bacterium]